MGGKLKGYFYFISIYFYEENNKIEGTNKFNDSILNIAIKIHNLLISLFSIFIDIEWSYPIRIKKCQE